MRLTDQDIEAAKRKNIIEMATGFSAMMRIFSKKSKARIQEKLEEFFSGLAEIPTGDDYLARHQSFCEWFRLEVRTAERKLKNGKVRRSQPSSYGQAAKVLDIATKVCVYYCAQPTAEIAQRIVPFLNGAVDTAILKYLKRCKCTGATISATTIQEVDQSAYQALQLLVLAESRAHHIYPVQYDDIMFRKLNRDRLGSNKPLQPTAADLRACVP